MKHIYLVRHTEFENPDNIFHGRLSFSLSPAGKDHAKRIGRWFKDKKISKIYSSAVTRCQETAEILSDATGAPIELDKRLLEILTVIQGISLSEYRKDRNIRFAHVDSLGGETMMDVQIRMLDCFYELKKRDEGNVIICSHGDGLYFLYLALAGKDLPKHVKEIDPDEYQDKGTIRRIDVDGERCSIGSIETVS